MEKWKIGTGVGVGLGLVAIGGFSTYQIMSNSVEDKVAEARADALVIRDSMALGEGERDGSFDCNVFPSELNVEITAYRNRDNGRMDFNFKLNEEEIVNRKDFMQGLVEYVNLRFNACQAAYMAERPIK
tara:strand:+ start:6416 stop:6802 length:387 start_codon:yes stop_codon:yes gene_type:complete